MQIVIFGNSGSGKSTMAKQICSLNNLGHLDLDTLAWLPTSPPQRKSIADSNLEIHKFLNKNSEWVIEGCYSDLLVGILKYATEVIYMNLSVDLCIANARSRPWEPHKYSSKEEQDSNLDMLIDWISHYSTRKDTFSKSAHDELYNEFNGVKKMITSNPT